MVMETAKFLTAGRSYFTKSCFSEPCTLFTEQWVFSLFQTKPHETEKRDMEPNVLNWEPSGALFVPDSDPLRFYRRIGELGRSMLTAGGRLYFEINRAFGEAVASMLRKQGYTNVRIRKDISGNDRYVIAER